jgi:DNA-binding NtrC family response regulator
MAVAIVGVGMLAVVGLMANAIDSTRQVSDDTLITNLADDMLNWSRITPYTNQTFMPVGATEVRKVDVRIIAATNRDLPTMVRQGAFREDLYYRLNVVALRVPPLRERRQDIPILVEAFLRRLADKSGRRTVLSQAALDRLIAHEWPGNVRELENEIERLWVLASGDGIVQPEDLTPGIAGDREHRISIQTGREGNAAAGNGETRNLPLAVEALERRMIVEAIQRASGNKTRAADELGISRRNLIRKVHAYRIESGPGVED